MSKENAQKFLDDVNANESLKKALLGAAANAQAWVAAAATAGYQVTVDDLRAATEAVVGKSVSADQLAATLRGLFEGELSDADLDAVAGGLAPTLRKVLKINTQAVLGGVAPGGTQMEPYGGGEPNAPTGPKTPMGGMGGGGAL